MDFKTFIKEHENDDTSSLLLGRNKWPGIDMNLAASTILARRKLSSKVPGWLDEYSLVFPSALSAEQCSSAATASYKASVAVSLAGRRCREIADLTGGLGVDAVAFSKVSGKVLYNEMSESLAVAARHNFALLGAGNIYVRSFRVEVDNVEEILEGCSPDIIYLDPARRSESGSKVYRIEDCSPDVAVLAPKLLTLCRFVMVKLSPMADISMVARSLGHLKEIHVVGSAGECKELLAVLDREHEGEYRIIVAECGSGASVPVISFLPSEEASSQLLPAGAECLEGFSGDSPLCLFEPGSALLKSGAFKLVCSRYGLGKMAVSTHLYLAENVPEELVCFGKIFIVKEVHPMTKATLKEVERRYPRCEVTARNIKMTSEELRRRLGSDSGGAVHVFAAAVGSTPRNFLFVTEKRSLHTRL